MRVVDVASDLDAALMSLDERRISGDKEDEYLALFSQLAVPISAEPRQHAKIRTEGYPFDAKEAGMAFVGTIADINARVGNVPLLQLQVKELAAAFPHGPAGHSGGPVLMETSDGGPERAVGFVRSFPADPSRTYAIGGTVFATRLVDVLERFGALRIDRIVVETGLTARRAVDERNRLHVSDADPLDLGVHPAIANIRDRGALPTYVERPHDEAMRGALRDIAAPRMVVAIGESSSGKTRACFEAIRTELPDWILLCPRSPRSLLALLRDGVPARSVLWLNETQNYLTGPDSPAVAAALTELLIDSAQPVAVVGNMWPSAWRALRRVQDGPLAPTTLVRDLFAVTRVQTIEIAPDFRHPQARQALLRAAESDSTLAEAIRAAGDEMRVAQNLAGGPQVLQHFRELKSSRVPVERAAAAILESAMEARRLGYNAPIPVQTLERAAVAYLEDRYRVQPSRWFTQALTIATEQQLGVEALEGVRTVDSVGLADSYRLHDYLLQFAMGEWRRRTVPETLWQALLEHMPPPEIAVNLARSADNRALHYVTQPFLEHAAAAGDPHAIRLLSDLLAERVDEDALRRVADAGGLGAEQHLVQSLARRAASAELRELEKQGIADATRALIDLAVYRGDVVELRRRSSAGDRYAYNRLLELYLARGNVDELLDLVTSGDAVAGERLMRLLVGHRQIPSLLRLASASDEQSYRLVSYLETRRDSELLTQLAKAGHIPSGVWLIESVITNRAFSELERILLDPDMVDSLRAAVTAFAGRNDIENLLVLEQLDYAGAHDAVVKVLVDRGDWSQLLDRALAGGRKDREGLVELVTALCASSADTKIADALSAIRAGDLHQVSPLMDLLHALGDAPLKTGSSRLDADDAYVGESGYAALMPRMIQLWVDVGEAHGPEALDDYVELLSLHGRREELERLSREGHKLAARRLLELNIQQGRTRELQEQAVGPYGLYAADELVSLMAGNSDVAGLQERADGGDQYAEEELVVMLFSRGDEPRLRDQADTGNLNAAARLCELLVARGDADKLRAERNAANTRDAGRALLTMYASGSSRAAAQGLNVDGTGLHQFVAE